MGVVANAAEGAGRDTERAQRGAAEPRERPHTAESSGAEKAQGRETASPMVLHCVVGE